MSFDLFDPEYIAARNAALLRQGDGYAGMDESDPKSPSGHASGIHTSTRLTTYYRQTHREQAVDVTPQQVIDCLNDADIKNWILMGLHGYVGYLPMPRATQDVDVMVPYSQKERAAKAVAERWPMLQKLELSQVVRFLDPGDPDSEGQPKPVIDIMLPWGKFQETILKHHVIVDKKTGHRIPTVEAAVVSKYATVISPYRSIEKKEFDAGDLRFLIKTNIKQINRDSLISLASEVWERGGEDILKFLDLALTDKPFPS